MQRAALGWVVITVSRRIDAVDVACTLIERNSTAAPDWTAAGSLRRVTLIEEAAAELTRLLFEGHLTPTSRSADFAAGLGGRAAYR